MIWLLAMGCAGQDSLRWQEQWELLILDRDRSAFDVRFSRSNTAWLKGTPKVRAELYSKKEGSIYFGLDGMPQDVQMLPSGISIGPDLLRGHPGGWEIQLQEGAEYGDPRDARLALSTSGDPGRRLDWPDESWSVVPLELLAQAHGFVSNAGRDRMIGGRALLMYRGGERSPVLWDGAERVTLAVLGPDLSIGIDQTGGQAISWALIDGTLVWGEAVLSGDFEQGWLLDFAPELPLTVQVRTQDIGQISQPNEHLMGAEQVLLKSWRGTLVREMHTGKARVQMGDTVTTASAVVVRVSWQ